MKYFIAGFKLSKVQVLMHDSDIKDVILTLVQTSISHLTQRTHWIHIRQFGYMCRGEV